MHTYMIGYYNLSHRLRCVYNFLFTICRIVLEAFNRNFIYYQSFCKKFAEKKQPEEIFVHIFFVESNIPPKRPRQLHTNIYKKVKHRKKVKIENVAFLDAKQ